MDLLLPLISLLLVTGGGGGWFASFADAATANSEEIPKAYWEAVLPGIPMPPATINLLLAQQNVHTSLDDVNINPNNLKFLKGARKIGSNYEKHKPEPDHEDKHVHISSQVEDSLKENSISYGSQGEEDIEKGISVHKPRVHRDLKGASMLHGSQIEEDGHNKFLNKDAEDPHKVTMSYGSEHEDDPHKATMSYGSEHEEDPHKLTMTHGSEQEEDPHKTTMSYGIEYEDDPHKVTLSYGGSGHEKDLKTFSTRHATLKVKGEGSHHAHSDNHGNKKQADVFFFHDMLRLGSLITPTVPPTTSLPALLPRGVAKSIPFSMEHLFDIMKIFAPASLAMAREIRWTLDTCDHPRTLPGQKAGCATSLESLADLAVSLHGTRNVRAFSAANLPIDAAGTPALRGMYNVTAMRKLSESPGIVTCHDLTYPYAVYYCHTANPTAAYTVTLTSMDGATAPAVMEALAVCHLDTSQWSPRNPFFELHNLRPGDVTVCHFLTKLSIIWVRGGEQGDAHVAAR